MFNTHPSTNAFKEEHSKPAMETELNIIFVKNIIQIRMCVHVSV